VARKVASFEHLSLGHRNGSAPAGPSSVSWLALEATYNYALQRSSWRGTPPALPSAAERER